MTSLITGGAGFIGSHLAEALVARGQHVILLDDLSTGSVENIRHLRDHPNVQCVFESVMDRALSGRAGGRIGCDLSSGRRRRSTANH